jgi:hypothetical protein
MRRIVFLLTALSAATEARATLPVVDYTHIGADAVHQVINVAHYAATEANTLTGYLTAVRQYEQMLVNASRVGDLSTLRALPGMSSVTDLTGSVGQLYRQYAAIQQNAQLISNPQQYQSNVSSILSQWQRPDWQGWTSANGTAITPNPATYQWDVARYNLANHFGDVLQQLQQKRAALQLERDQVAKLQESSTDQAQQTKYSAQLAHLDQAIAQVDQQSAQAKVQHDLQAQKVSAAQQVGQAASFEQGQAAQYQSIDRDFQTLPSTAFRAPVHFSN